MFSFKGFKGLLTTSTIQSALIVALGFTLALWTFAAYDFNRQLQSVRLETDAIDARYAHDLESLSTLHRQLLSVDASVRRMDQASNLALFNEYQREFDESLAAADATLLAYASSRHDVTTSEHLTRLQAEVDGLHRMRPNVLTDDFAARPTPADLAMSDPPGAGLAFRVSWEIQQITRKDLLRTSSDVTALHTALQGQHHQRFGIMLIISALLGLVAAWRAGRLERRLLQQREIVDGSARDLRQLSGELMTAQEGERRRLARELQDEIGPTLTAIKVDLAGLKKAPPGADLRPLLSGSRALADGALQSVRYLSRLLHPPLLDELGLPMAIEAQAREFRRRHIPCDVSCSGLEKRLLPAIEVSAYRIVQEGLSNVAKHAHATTCRVSLNSSPDALSIFVEDDGVGFDTSDKERLSNGLGLIGIRERVAALGGALSIHSDRDRGTRLTVRVPLLPGSFAASEESLVDRQPASTEPVHV